MDLRYRLTRRPMSRHHLHCMSRILMKMVCLCAFWRACVCVSAHLLFFLLVLVVCPDYYFRSIIYSTNNISISLSHILSFLNSACCFLSHQLCCRKEHWIARKPVHCGQLLGWTGAFTATLSIPTKRSHSNDVMSHCRGPAFQLLLLAHGQCGFGRTGQSEI